MKNLLLVVAFLSAFIAVNAQTDPDIPIPLDLKITPADTSNKHGLLSEMLWTMYFVDATNDNVLDYGVYEFGYYEDAKLRGLPTFAVTWPGGWSYGYERGKGILYLTPKDLGQDTLTISVTMEELDSCANAAEEKEANIERRAAEHTYDYEPVVDKEGRAKLIATPREDVIEKPRQERPVLRYRKSPLPKMIIRLSRYAKIHLHRDLDPKKGPETMIVVSDK